VDIAFVLIVFNVADLPTIEPDEIIFVLIIFDVNNDSIVALLIYNELKYKVLIGSGIKNGNPLIEEMRSDDVLTLPAVVVLTNNVLNSKASIFNVPCGVY
jgi:hypothetical protein